IETQFTWVIKQTLQLLARAFSMPFAGNFAGTHGVGDFVSTCKNKARCFEMRCIFWFVNALLFGQLASIMAMPVPEDVKQVVGFVFVADSSGKVKPQGTGFFVTVKDPKVPD